MINLDEPSDLFVSSIEGQPVARYGSPRVHIGCHRDETGFVFQPDDIVMIPADEAARYFREYNQALREKSLKVRTREEWAAQNLRHAAPAPAPAPAAPPAIDPPAGNQE